MFNQVYLEIRYRCVSYYLIKYIIARVPECQTWIRFRSLIRDLQQERNVIYLFFGTIHCNREN